MSKNAILCAFNCSNTSPCTTWAEELFASPPTIVALEGGSSSTFKQTGAKFTTNPHAWLQARKVDGKVAVVTFSAGWGFIDTVMRNPPARDLVDAVILLDGLHCSVSTLDPWVAYAKRAAMGGDSMPLLMLVHSRIVPPYTSAKATNAIVYEGGVLHCPSPGPRMEHPEMTRVTLDSPITISSAYGSRTWKKDPLAEWHGAGNLYRYEYEGGDAPTHIYLAKHVQPRAWKVLAKRWNGANVEGCEAWRGSGREE